ncbi:hypothetical protein [Aurantivibrio plasticivorans]
MVDSNNQKPSEPQDGVTYFNAASAGVAQSVSLGAQNYIDEMRHQGIVKMTAMGSTYAKWLANPEIGENMYKPLIDSLNENDQSKIDSVNTFLKECIDLTLSPKVAGEDSK